MRSKLRSTPIFLLAALAALVTLTACAGDLPVDTEGAVERLGPALASEAGAPFYGTGARARAAPHPACETAEHAQFDFWLGEWDVFDPGGQQVGTNAVTRELDGCVVAEEWVAANGVPGRSINTFDRETGEWHQTWASANFSGHLRMSGGIDDDGRMVLSGQREGVLQGVTLFDEYTWTTLDDGRVQQVGVLRVPAAGFEGSFTGIYEPRDEITPAPETPTAGCQPGGPAEQARQLDFWIGEWTVSTSDGGTLGTSTVSADLSGCLIEETFQGRDGYRSIGFAVFDFWEQRWFRTVIDNRGERVALSGGLEGSSMVLTGAEHGPGGSGSLPHRVILTPDGPDVLQRIQVSPNEAAGWQTVFELRYSPVGDDG